MRIKRLVDNLPALVRAHPGDAGVDLYAREGAILMPRQRKLVPTGVAVEIPIGQVGLVMPRSGLAHKFGITVLNAPGVVDAGYRGEVMVNLVNLSDEVRRIQRFDRIAQLVVQRVELPELEFVDELPDSSRGDGGHGSSGV